MAAQSLGLSEGRLGGLEVGVFVPAKMKTAGLRSIHFREERELSKLEEAHTTYFWSLAIDARAFFATPLVLNLAQAQNMCDAQSPVDLLKSRALDA